MKKTILLLLTCILFAAFFTGCPDEAQPEDKYPREFIFDKSAFDRQRKAWEESRINNYQYAKGFRYDGETVLKRITVKDGKPVSKEYFWKNRDENLLYGESLVFEEYEDKGGVLYKAPIYIDKMYVEAIQQAKDLTIDDIYRAIEADYILMKAEDMKKEKIVKIENKIQYDEKHHIPLVYSWKTVTEEEYDGHQLIGEWWGWESKIYDFKVLD